ncbi:MAG: hypothetical protein B7C24_12030 [Bacteroidetes bacterium 4572_77]|nr:MAG: hypothetical protein B7C24_12030 [Bacteroidetes bacterium 4572_77]
MKTRLLGILVLMFVVFAFVGWEKEAYSDSADSKDLLPEKSITYDDLNYFDTEIAKIENNQILFVQDVVVLKTKWENFINNNSDLHVFFDDVKIFKENDNYFLRGKDANSRSSSVLQLTRIGDKLYERKEAGGGSVTITCTTSATLDSSGECEPTINPGKGYYCTDCSEGTCTKTSTRGMLGIGL